ncbi:hypothetical protein E3J61_01715 [Candidatus Dependentiae bacterium]|nr:MAG: hypothetical protein E3J61_01715 [Candidatus Dependentiae bacterium]
MKRYGVLFALIMVGSMVAQGDKDKEGSFLRRSDSRDIPPRKESGKDLFSSLPSALMIRESLRRRQRAREGVLSVLLDEQEAQRETHALFELEKGLST